MIEYAHANKLHQELGKGQWSSRDGSKVNIIAIQCAGEFLDMAQGTNLTAGSASIPHLQTAHIESEGEVSETTTVILIEPDDG